MVWRSRCRRHTQRRLRAMAARGGPVSIVDRQSAAIEWRVSREQIESPVRPTVSPPPPPSPALTATAACRLLLLLLMLLTTTMMMMIKMSVGALYVITDSPSSLENRITKYGRAPRRAAPRRDDYNSTP